MAKEKENQKEVLVRNGNRTRSVSADDIYYIGSSNRKVTLYLRVRKLNIMTRSAHWKASLSRIFPYTQRVSG